MRKSPKNIGGREKQSVAQTLEIIAASLESSPTAGGHVATPREKATDDSYTPTDKEKTNAPALPRELRQQKTDWTNIFGLIGVVIAVLTFIGGIIFWFAKLDSKVDTTASDVAVIKPKVDQLVINSEKQDVRLGNLEKPPATPEKTHLRK